MKRRDFLKLSPALPFVLNGFPLSAAGEQHPLLRLLQDQTIVNGRVLVLVQLSGGNDGLNTVIPLDQYSRLSNARSNILIPDYKTLPLNGYNATALHPSMPGMQQLFNNQQLNIVQAVSYPNPNFSHFRSTDILFSGSAADQYLNTGWVGRALDATYPGFPEAYLNNPAVPDPLVIQIGSQATQMTQCSKGNMAMTLTDPNYFFNLIEGVTDPAPDTPYGHELTFVRLIKQQTNQYTSVIRSAYNKAANMAGYDPNNSLAQQLKIVACLIKGGLQTPVYLVSHNGSFDTHANQVDASDTTRGRHADLLSTLSDAMSSFQQDLLAMNIANRVVSTTITEFGRRIKSNDSLGSDHGTATPMFFFGTAVNPAIVGTNPVIPQVATTADQVPMQHDFRAVYYTILKEWFQLTDSQLLNVWPAPYTTVPIFRDQVALPVTILRFSGKWQSSDVALSWSVDHESNIDYYEVQRSADGAAFSNLGTVNANGVSAVFDYHFTDASPALRRYFYRLRIVEKSGAVNYSSTILLETNAVAGSRIKVLPNPVTEQFALSFEKPVSGQVTVSINDMSGREVWREEKQSSNDYLLRLSLSGKKPAQGNYIVNVYAQHQHAALPIVVL